MSEPTSPIQYTTPQTKGSIVPIFPTPLGSYDFGNLIKPEVIDFIKNDLTYNLNRSNRTSIEGNVLDFPVMTEIKEFCELCVKEYTDTIYDQAFDTTFHITQSWSNITEPNEFHHKHTHPNSIVSGVMYLQTNEDDKIEFVGDPAIHKRIALDSKSFNDLNLLVSYMRFRFINITTKLSFNKCVEGNTYSVSCVVIKFWYIMRNS